MMTSNTRVAWVATIRVRMYRRVRIISLWAQKRGVGLQYVLSCDRMLYKPTHTPCVYVESLNVDVAIITITVTLTLETKMGLKNLAPKWGVGL